MNRIKSINLQLFCLMAILEAEELSRKKKGMDLQLFSWYPENPKLGQLLQTNVPGVSVDKGFLAHFQVAAAQAVAASATGVHAAVTDTGEQQVITTGITNPAVPRNITATAGGTAGDIKAIQVVIAGTNYLDEAITETLPVFTVDTAGIVAGSKAFKTVTSITIPAHDGTGATTSVGWGDKLGLPFLLSHNTVLHTFIGNAIESVAATVACSATAIESNTMDLNSALNSTVVDAYIMI